jgi:HNH endonuclease
MIKVANGFYNFTEPDIERFNASYTKTELTPRLQALGLTTGCWEWQHHPHNGYGQFKTSIAIKPRKYFKAHRASWIINIGEIPRNMLVLHTCDNRKCVNPEHLWLGTAKDNVNDMFAKGRNCEITSPLTKHDIIQIRDMHKQGTKVHDIVQKFNKSQNTIEDIIYRRTWKSL